MTHPAPHRQKFGYPRGLVLQYVRVTALILFLLALSPAALHAEDSPPADAPLSTREQQAMKAALARVAPSVVRIETVGGLERLGQMLVGTGPTTGLVVSADGYVISSAFNFAQKPDSILVTLNDGTRHSAKLVATDHSRMLVLLKVDAANLPVPEFVPPSEMRVGQWALAVGRTFEADQANLSVGIVSALQRIWGKAIQTDAKISPNNYGGPLVDISGRVLGVLVPMSPQASAESAGVEWYDSGIGFAVPFETVLRMLPKLEQGDLHAGLLGISMKGGDIYSDPAKIAVSRATGPAFKAGVRAGDTIVEIGGVPIARQAQLKHQLGPLYAGESLKLTVLRGEERLPMEVQLADKIEPYVTPFLGILPMRDASEAGVTIRYVYPDSPAAAVGLKPGDRLQSVAGQGVKNSADVLEKLQTLNPGDAVEIEVRRGEETLALKPVLGTLPEALPGELPPSRTAISKPAKVSPADDSAVPAEKPEDTPAVGIVPIKLPEFPNACFAYVPESAVPPTGQPKQPLGLIVWLHTTGGVKQDEVVALWKPLCDKYGFVLLVPQAADPASWEPSEVPYVRRVIDDVIKRYPIDPTRVVVHGQEGGGALAYVLGIMGADIVRGVAVVDAPLPGRSPVPETDPVRRQAFYSAAGAEGEKTPAIEEGVKRLREAKYPVTVQPLGGKPRYLTNSELEELVRWCDSLDRL